MIGPLMSQALTVHAIPTGPLTAATAAIGGVTWLMGQANPMPAFEGVGAVAAIAGAFAVAARTAGELGKAWLAYKEAQLHAAELVEKVAKLEADRDAQKTLIDKKVCPFSPDGSPACAAKPAPPRGRRPRRDQYED